MSFQVPELLNQGWLALLVGTILSLWGIFESKRPRGPKICLQYRGIRILGLAENKLPEQIEVKFNGMPVRSLSKTIIVIWNSGIPVRADDIRPETGLNISFGRESDANIILCELNSVSRDDNHVNIDYKAGTPSGVNFSFDFLDRNDGAVITVWHDSHDVKPRIRGTIVGQSTGVLNLGKWIEIKNVDMQISKDSSFHELIRDALFIFTTHSARLIPIPMMVFGVVISLVPLINSTFNLFSEASNIFGEKIYPYYILGFTYFLSGAFTFNLQRRRFPKSLVDGANSESGLD